MKKTDNGLDALDVVSIVILTLKVLGVEPVANWSWLLVLGAIVGIYAAAIALMVVAIAVAAAISKSNNNENERK